MPLKITLGVDSDHHGRARQLLRDCGADSTRKVGNDVEGIFSGISNPNGAKADQLISWLQCEMQHRAGPNGKAFYFGIYLKEAEQVKGPRHG